MILVGTSGFSYPDWHGPFYPEGLPKAEELVFYARHFAALELNFSYYRTWIAGGQHVLILRPGRWRRAPRMSCSRQRPIAT